MPDFSEPLLRFDFDIQKDWPIIAHLLDPATREAIRNIHADVFTWMRESDRELLQRNEKLKAWLNTEKGKAALAKQQAEYAEYLERRAAGSKEIFINEYAIASPHWEDILSGKTSPAQSYEFSDGVFPYDKLRSELQKRVLDPIRQPYPILLEELIGLLSSHLHVLPQHFEPGYDSFILAVHSCITRIGHSEHIRIASIEPGADVWALSDDKRVLWHRDALFLHLSNVEASAEAHKDMYVHAPYHFDHWFTGFQGERHACVLSAALSGAYSEGAYRYIHDRLIPGVYSILRSAAYLCGIGSVENGLPTVSLAVFECHHGFIEFCIGRLLTDPEPKKENEPKDPFDRRIRNAIAFLTEADNAQHPMFQMAATMMALEAVVGNQAKKNVTESMASYVAVLLERERQHLDRAKNFVKKLYKTRSDLMHGRIVDVDPTIANSARELAAGVLAAMIEYYQSMLAMKKMEYAVTATIEEYFMKLDEALEDSSIPTGRIETLVRRFWLPD